jgi:hypothetical protein
MVKYVKQWTRNNPGQVIIIGDTSGSMSLKDAEGYTLIERLEIGANSGIVSSLMRNLFQDGVKNKATFTVITYGNGGAKIVCKKSIADFATEGDTLPTKTVSTSAGNIEVPQFISGLIAAGGTPMAAGFDLAYKEAEAFCKANPDSAPTIIVHITDGMPNNPSAAIAAANRCRALFTSDGNVLVFNLHMSTNSSNKVLFPASEGELSDAAAKLLYRISDVLPKTYWTVAQAEKLPVKENSRMMTQNGNGEDIAKIINFGSTVADNANAADVTTETFSY